MSSPTRYVSEATPNSSPASPDCSPALQIGVSCPVSKADELRMLALTTRAQQEMMTYRGYELGYATGEIEGDGGAAPGENEGVQGQNLRS
ncbi:unnamed protein product [Cylicostephanus goldi]|uniref:Uncharacterized protein n=1 Tax=Cylicostephanus goldi TaxID=71465 RepID=A0A3P6SBE7_CYLGO|nr:unnamed protein product [Cylicostephanus goldi]